jgi:large subunit ribosomal protein L24
MKPLVYRKSRRRRPAPKQRPVKLHIAKGDRVRVISGAHRGAEGVVKQVLPRKSLVVVQGINIVTKHRRATANTEATIVKEEAPIHASNVMLLDPKSGQPTRIRRQKDKDGTVERISVKSGQSIPRNR